MFSGLSSKVPQVAVTLMGQWKEIREELEGRHCSPKHA